MNQEFKPGDTVYFKGFKEAAASASSVVGELLLTDKNTLVKGVMKINNDTQGMLFCPDGTIYCHPRFGVMIQIVDKDTGEIQGII